MSSALKYSTSVAGMDADALADGFFEGWAARPSREEHLELLASAAHRVVALDSDAIVGFATALSDGVLCAYIPLLEVLPPYRGAAVGSELIRRLLADVGPLYMVDVMCDRDVMPFYEKLGFQASTGGVLRNYAWNGRS